VADPALEAWQQHRPLLFTVAYQLLGSASDAEDTLQESWLRWAEVDVATVRDPRAYLVRLVTRQALNQLRSRSRRRESYVGPWLPEPLLTAPDVAEDVELADSVSMAMLVVLETLTPLERAVFVLREVFGFEYDEVAAATGRSTAAVRQLAHRAREHVRARRPRMTVGAEAEQVAASFLDAAATGDVARLLELLAPDVVLVSDGGGKATAALRPVHGADKVARFLAGVASGAGEATVEWRPVNGTPSALVHVDGRLDVVVSGVVVDGRVAMLYLVRNPDKLTRLAEEHHLRRT
jgi:RNA polymerase sigma-70 factor (ECF subfamily)